MALQTVSGGLWIPNYEYFTGTGLPTIHTTLTIDANGELAAFVFRAPKTGTLAKVRIRFGTVSIGANTDLLVSFQDVAVANGDPDGTADQYRVIPTAAIVTDTTVLSGLITSNGADGGTKRSVTKGDLVACVIGYNTFNASDSVIIGAIRYAAGGSPTLYGFPDLYTASWSKQSQICNTVSVEYDDGTYAYAPGLWPAVSATGTVAYGNTATPDAIGLKFRFPGPVKIGGCWIGMDADGDFLVRLYTSSGVTTVATVDKDTRCAVGSMTGFLLFTAEQTLAANTDYVLAIEPSSATNDTLAYIDVAAAAELDQLGGGQNFHYATAKDPATTADFTATTTRRPMIGLLVTALDDGVQTGGGGLPILGGSVVR